MTAYEQKALRNVYNALRFAQKALRYGKNVAGFARKPPRNFVPRPPERYSKAAGTLFQGRRNVVPRPPERLSQAVGQPWNIMPIQKLRKSNESRGKETCFSNLL